MSKHIEQAVGYLDECGVAPDAFVVLGSGLGGLVEKAFPKRVDIPYADVPGFPLPTVAGHGGMFSYIPSKRLILFRGRKHLYEGGTIEELLTYHATAVALGAKRALITCAVGGLNPSFAVGDLVLITDYINLLPAVMQYSGRAEAVAAIDIAPVMNAAEKAGIALQKGVLAAVLGPTYETKAEVEMLRRIGADLVSMSTAPEIDYLRREGVEVWGIATITNMAGVIHTGGHQQVVDTANRAAEKLMMLIKQIFPLAK